MGHNASQSRRRANVLAACLGAVRGCRIVASCDGCGRMAELDCGVLADRHG